MNEESIFAKALALKTAQARAAYLDEQCAGQPELRAQVEQLLQADADAGSFLSSGPTYCDATVEVTNAGTRSDNSFCASDVCPFLEPCDKPDRIGRLHDYEIIEVVGRGGMGTVLRAFDTKLSRIVAVKMMAPELAVNPMAVKRFLREATTAAAVVHDHVVTIHAVNDLHRPPYLVMEYIEGQTLQQKVDREGALDVKHILRIGCQMAAGLAAAHKHGLIHRDVKPANILLENNIERVKITDFGLARAANDLEITQTGVIAGTPQYMSPEQAKGVMIDERSDLFSLGSVLYTLCTGRPAFRAETTMGVLQRVCHDVPRPIPEINPEIPPWLIAIVAKLQAKEPADRFQTANEVTELLGQHLLHEQNPSQVSRPPMVSLAATQATASSNESSPWLGGLGVVIILVVSLCFAMLALLTVGGLAFFASPTWGEKSPPNVAPQPQVNGNPTLQQKVTKPPLRAETAAIPPVNLTTWGEFVDPLGDCKIERREHQALFQIPGAIPRNFMPSTAGGMNAPRLLHDAQGDFDLHVRMLPFSKSTAGTSIANDNSTSWRSAGLLVLIDDNNFLRLERVSWGERNKGRPMAHCEWFVKGQRVGDHYAPITDDDRSTMFRISRRGPDLHLSYSDDGTSWEDFPVPSELTLPGKMQVGLLAVQTTSREFDPVFEDLRFGEIKSSTSDAEAASEPLLSAATVRAAPRFLGWGGSWSPDGKQFVRDNRKNDSLEIVDLATGDVRLLHEGGADPAWSPQADGPIAFVTNTQWNDAKRDEIWLIQPDGTHPRKLSKGGYPSWSQDGQTLYCRGFPTNQVWSLNWQDSAAEPVAYPIFRNSNWYPAVSPDGSKLVVHVHDRVIIKDLNDSRQWADFSLPQWNGLLASWSPDNRYVVFGSYGNKNDKRGIWLFDVAANQKQLLAAGTLTFPRWSPDGRRIAVADRSKSEIVMLDVSGLNLTNGLPNPLSP